MSVSLIEHYNQEKNLQIESQGMSLNYKWQLKNSKITRGLKSSQDMVSLKLFFLRYIHMPVSTSFKAH
jgi:hypothetical protein